MFSYPAYPENTKQRLETLMRMVIEIAGTYGKVTETILSSPEERQSQQPQLAATKGRSLLQQFAATK